MPDLPITKDYKGVTKKLSSVLHQSMPVQSMIVVDGKLLGKQRPKHFTRGTFSGTYTPKKTVDYERHVANCFKEFCEPMPENKAIFIEVIIYHEYPQTSKVKLERMRNLEIVPAKQPDIDNIEKIIMDGLEKTAYKRDSLIVGSLKYKKYSNEPRVDVSLWEL